MPGELGQQVVDFPALARWLLSLDCFGDFKKTTRILAYWGVGKQFLRLLYSLRGRELLGGHPTIGMELAAEARPQLFF